MPFCRLPVTFRSFVHARAGSAVNWADLEQRLLLARLA